MNKISALNFNNVKLGKGLDLYFAEHTVYLSAAQLYNLGVATDKLSDSIVTFGGYGFCTFVDFNDVSYEHFPDALQDWWRDIALPEIDNFCCKFKNMHFWLKNKLHYDLFNPPTLTPKLRELEIYPLWILKNTGMALIDFKNATTLELQRVIVDENRRRDERLKSAKNKMPKRITADDMIIMPFMAPNGIRVDIYRYDNRRQFVDAEQLAKAMNYPAPSFDINFGSDFYRCVQLSACFYTVNMPKVALAKWFIDVRDVPLILTNYNYYLADDVDTYSTVKDLIGLFANEIEEFESSTATQSVFNTPSSQLDNIATFTRVPKAAIIDFIINQRRELSERELVDLKEQLQ